MASRKKKKSHGKKNSGGKLCFFMYSRKLKGGGRSKRHKGCMRIGRGGVGHGTKRVACTPRITQACSR